MCNRYENELPTSAWVEFLTSDVHVTDEAMAWEPLHAQNVTTTGLCLVERDNRWTLRTAVWGFYHPHYQEETFNMRTDRAPVDLLPPVYRHESGTNRLGLAKIWQGGDLRRCWMPATAWLECLQRKTTKTPAIWKRMHLGGEPFVLAGACGERDGKFRMTMAMTETPEIFPELWAAHHRHRMPLAFGVDAVGLADPRNQVHDRIEVTSA